MKKAINITIANTLFYIEEDAYAMLDGYLCSIREHFAGYPDKDEITADIEARICEKFSANASKIITVEDVRSLMESMGAADEFGDAAEAPAGEQAPQAQPQRKLYRDTDNAVIGGVCSGIAAYLGIDVTIVRLLFVISIFFGGTGIVVYLVLWIAMPEARTATEKLQMRGDPVTLERVNDMVKEKADEVRKRANDGSWSRAATLPARVAQAIIAAIRRVLPLFAAIVGAFTCFMATAVAIAVSVAALSALFNSPSSVVDFPLAEAVRGPLFYAIVAFGYLTLIVPAILAFFIGLSLARSKNMFSTRLSLPLFAVWLVSATVFGASMVTAEARYEEFVRTDPRYAQSTRRFDTAPFTRLEVRDNVKVRLVRGATTTVAAAGRLRDIDEVRLTVDDGALTIERDSDARVCIFCRARSVEMTITAPTLESVKLRNASRIEGTGLEFADLKLALMNVSSADLSLKAASLDVSLENASNARLSGSSPLLVADLENMSHLDADALATASTTLTLSNMSYAGVNALEFLSVRAEDASRVEYSGEPEIERTLEGGASMLGAFDDGREEFERAYRGRPLPPQEPENDR